MPLDFQGFSLSNFILCYSSSVRSYTLWVKLGQFIEITTVKSIYHSSFTSICIQNFGISDIAIIQPLFSIFLKNCMRMTRTEFCNFLISPQVIHSQIRLIIQGIGYSELIDRYRCNGYSLLGLESVGSFHICSPWNNIVNINFSWFTSRD